MSESKPWNSADATNRLRQIARSDEFDLWTTKHSMERMVERNLIMGDVLHVLKYGFVHEPAVESTRQGFFKYLIESSTPNSGAREVRVVVVPDEGECAMKIVTVMWKDERSTRAGSIMEE